MSQSTTKKYRIRLRVGIERSDEFFHAYAEPLYFDTQDNTWSCGFWYVRPNGLYLRDFCVHSQGDNRSKDRPEGPLYSWQIRYSRVHSVDLNEAEAMAKTLRTIQRKLDALKAKLGREASFGAFVVRVADALGAEAIEMPPYKGDPRRDERVYHTLGDAVYPIDRMIHDFVNPQEEKSA